MKCGKDYDDETTKMYDPQINLLVDPAFSIPALYRWPGGVMVSAYVGLRLERSRVQLPAEPLSGNDLGQVVHTHVPLSPSSIIWYQSHGSDALRLGR